jgi:DNA-binding PadR family transcriptional regulator
MSPHHANRELKKGSADLLILTLLEIRPRHGYDLAKLIEERSEGTLRFNAASLYPLLYRLERAGWIDGRWVEKGEARRRRLFLQTDGIGTKAARRTAQRLGNLRSGHRPRHRSGTCMTGVKSCADGCPTSVSIRSRTPR